MAVRRHASGYNALHFLWFGPGMYMQWTECGPKSATAAALLLLQHVLSRTVSLLLVVPPHYTLFRASLLLLLGCHQCVMTAKVCCCCCRCLLGVCMATGLVYVPSLLWGVLVDNNALHEWQLPED
jgi:hypothetical protein